MLHKLQFMTHPPERTILRILIVRILSHNIIPGGGQQIALCDLLLLLLLLHFLFSRGLQLLLKRFQRVQRLFLTIPHIPHILGFLSGGLVLMLSLLSQVLRSAEHGILLLLHLRRRLWFALFLLPFTTTHCAYRGFSLQRADLLLHSLLHLLFGRLLLLLLLFLLLLLLLLFFLYLLFLKEL